MPRLIENDEELKTAVVDAGSCLQGIQDYLEHRNDANGRVRFPRGYIKTAAYHRRRLPQLHNQVLAKNISYTLMTLDVLRWNATRTDLHGQALDMIVKEAICLIGSICEALTLRKGVQGLGRKKSFVNRTERMVDMGLIDENLKTDLDWIWGIRSRGHLNDIGLLEWNHYERDDHNRARNAMSILITRLREHYGDHVET